MSTSRFTPANHLLPTLFDRLCDNAPYQKIDRDISVTPVQLKEIIRRDLSFLRSRGLGDVYKRQPLSVSNPG